jgi:hypothetical protein
MPFFHGTSQSHNRAYPKTTSGNEKSPIFELRNLTSNIKNKKSHECIKKTRVSMGAHPQEVQSK